MALWVFCISSVVLIIISCITGRITAMRLTRFGEQVMGPTSCWYSPAEARQVRGQPLGKGEITQRADFKHRAAVTWLLTSNTTLTEHACHLFVFLCSGLWQLCFIKNKIKSSSFFFTALYSGAHVASCFSYSRRCRAAPFGWGTIPCDRLSGSFPEWHTQQPITCLHRRHPAVNATDTWIIRSSNFWTNHHP